MNKFAFLHFIKVVAAIFFVSVGSKDVNAKVTLREMASRQKGAVVWFEEFMPAKDGVNLYTLGVAPKGVKCPTVVKRNPYVPTNKVDVASWIRDLRKYTDRGYAVIYQHCRGTGSSEGEWIPYEVEREDGLALLDHVRKLPWYNGEIFLSGGSYSATVHWSYLNTNPSDIKGAALFVQDVNRYNVCYRNGFFKIGLHGEWYAKGYKKKNPNLKRNKSASLYQFPLCDFPRRYWGEEVPTMYNKICNPRPDAPFWSSDEPGSGACCRDALLKSTMPVLLKTGFYDIYTDGVFAMWRELPAERRANCALIVDAYDHGGSPPHKPKSQFMVFPNASRSNAGVSDLDWFDSIRNNTLAKNPLLGKTRYYAAWENKWHDETSLEDGPRKISLKLGEGRRTYKYDPKRSLPWFPGSGGICFGGMQVQPRPSFRDDVVSFILPEIEEEIDVRGRMEAELSVSSDCEDTCFYIRLSVDKGDGNWILLRDDITSIAYDSPYKIGERRLLRFRFADHAFRLSKGDRLRVDVASANSQFAPHPNTAGAAFAAKSPRVANNTVYADDSRVIIHAAP